MAIDQNRWNKLLTYARNKIISLYDPSDLLSEQTDLFDLWTMPHCGFYVGIIDNRDNHLVREGFMKENLSNVKDSVDVIIPNIFSTLKNSDVTQSALKTYTFYLCVITDCVYVSDPLNWDENNDGIYFMWGQDYRALYLPYQIKTMNVPKVEIMDKLCCWGAGVPSSLWRYPEGMCFAIKCLSYSG